MIHTHYICIYTDICNLIHSLWKCELSNMKYQLLCFFFLKRMDKDFENESKLNIFVTKVCVIQFGKFSLCMEATLVYPMPMRNALFL